MAPFGNLKVGVELHGEKELILKINRIRLRGRDPRPVFHIIGREMLDSERKLFETGGRSGGTPWTPLTASTKKRKRKTGNANQRLVRTGAEMRSLSDKSDPDNIFVVKRTYVRIGSTNPALQYQFYGTKNMEPRDPIRFRPAQERRWVKHVKDFIINGELRA